MPCSPTRCDARCARSNHYSCAHPRGIARIVSLWVTPHHLSGSLSPRARAHTRERTSPLPACITILPDRGLFCSPARRLFHLCSGRLSSGRVCARTPTAFREVDGTVGNGRRAVNTLSSWCGGCTVVVVANTHRALPDILAGDDGSSTGQPHRRPHQRLRPQFSRPAGSATDQRNTVVTVHRHDKDRRNRAREAWRSRKRAG